MAMEHNRNYARYVTQLTSVHFRTLNDSDSELSEDYYRIDAHWPGHSVVAEPFFALTTPICDDEQLFAY